MPNVTHWPDCQDPRVTERPTTDGATVLRCTNCRAYQVVTRDPTASQPQRYACREHHQPVNRRGQGCRQCDTPTANQ